MRWATPSPPRNPLRESASELTELIKLFEEKLAQSQFAGRCKVALTPRADLWMARFKGSWALVVIEDQHEFPLRDARMELKIAAVEIFEELVERAKQARKELVSGCEQASAKLTSLTERIFGDNASPTA